MKTTPSIKSKTQGTTMVVSLMLCLVLSVTIAGYLKHASQQHVLSMRSQSWNTSIAVTEAGIEEALQHLNANTSTLESQGWTRSGNIYRRERVLSTDPRFGARYVALINAANMATPEITAQAFITDYSLGSGTAPVLAVANAGVTSPNSPTVNTLVSRAVRVTASKSGGGGIFSKALVAKYGITMNGNGVLTDSFNSSDTNHSNSGMYPVGSPSKFLSNGDIASNASSIGIVDAGNADIHGHVSVGPNGSMSLGPNGGVGTYGWRSTNNSGIQSGYFSDDMNFTFPSVTLPYTVGQSPLSGDISTTNYTYSSSWLTLTTANYPSPVPAGGVQTNIFYQTVATIPSPRPFGTTTNILTTSTTARTYPAAGTYSGTVATTVVNNGPQPGRGTFYTYNLITGRNYTYPTMTYTYARFDWFTNLTVTVTTYNNILQGSAPNTPPVDFYVSGNLSGTVLVKGNVRLVVANNATVNDLTIASDGKLEMYVGGTSLTLSGNNTMNKNGYAQRLIVWCTDSVTSISMSGNAGFTGCIYAPNAVMALNGGGNNNYDFIGSLLIKSITMNGHFSFHYDEALKSLNNNNGADRYLVKSWNEIPTTTTGITSYSY